MKFKKSIATLALLGTIFTAGSAMAFPSHRYRHANPHRLEHRYDARRYTPRPAVRGPRMPERFRHHVRRGW